jgi:hypothetical protein
MKAELVKQEFQDNLQGYMDLRLNELIDKLKNMKSNDFSVIELRNLISEKNLIGITPKYSNTELAILFDYYKQFIDAINKHTTYLPTKQNFCSFIGVSTATFNNYKQSDDSDRREIIQQIEDYITDIMLTSAQKGQIKEISTMFRAKAEHGYVEAQAPIIIEHKNETDVANIMKQIEAVNKGRSLKEINLVQNDKGVYVEEENK